MTLLLDAPTEHESHTADSVEKQKEEKVVKIPSPILSEGVDIFLGFWGATLDGIEDLRKKSGNRVGTMLREGDHGHGLSESNPYVGEAIDFADGLEAYERMVVKQLERTMKEHPLGPWVQDQNGLGLKTVARYLAMVDGDPAWNGREGRLRTLRELWSYSGLAVVNGQAPTRNRGVQGQWSKKARMRAWNIAQPIIKGKGPYRDVYDEARAKYADAVHSLDCVRCGPSGSPALAGSPLSLGHQHARAIRLVAKTVTKDLWTEARRLHTGEVTLP